MGNYREINLEAGRPTTRQAVGMLLRTVENSPKGQVLKLIHGYGSSGTGGAIRVEVRRKLARMKQEGRVKMFVYGENLSIFDVDTRRLLDLAPSLRSDRDLERHNNGITVVVI